MKVIWVLENTSYKEDYYSKFNILVLLASVTQWSKYHPEDSTILYCDKLTYNLLDRIQCLTYWKEVTVIDFNLNVDKKVFWASSKLHVLSLQKEPVIIIDNDSLVYDNLYKHIDKSKVYVSNLEEGKGYYPLRNDSYVRKLSLKKRWIPKSVNVSFLYLPDHKFTNQYANLSIDIMEQFTKMKVPNSQYLIFAEQLLLAQMLREQDIEYSSLISTYWDCTEWDWGEEHSKGIWKYPESNKYYFHYGPLKMYYKSDDSKWHYLDYNTEIQKLKNCIGKPHLDLDFIRRK